MSVTKNFIKSVSTTLSGLVTESIIWIEHEGMGEHRCPEPRLLQPSAGHIPVEPDQDDISPEDSALNIGFAKANGIGTRSVFGGGDPKSEKCSELPQPPGAADSILLARLITWLTNKKIHIYLRADSSGAKGNSQRQGFGRLRHLSCRTVWLQSHISSSLMKLLTHCLALAIRLMSEQSMLLLEG